MNKHRPLIGLFLLAMACVTLAPSCTAKKKLIAPTAHADYEWMTAKMSLDIKAQDAEYKDVNGLLRVRRDSTIWISVSPMMGIEATRIRITSDSVVIVNRFDKTYLAEPIQQVAETLNLPLTLKESQSLLLGKGTDNPVVLQFGPYTAKIRYSDIHWDEPTTFPIKISESYRRMTL